MATYTLPTAGDTAWASTMADAIDAVNTDVESRADDASVVHNTGDETVGGLKEFSDGITVPDASIPFSAIDGLQDLADSSGVVKTVNSVSPDPTTGDVALSFTAADVGALASTATLDDIPDGTTNVGYTPAEKTKLAALPSAPFTTVKFTPYATSGSLPSASTSGAGTIAFLTGSGLVYSDGTAWKKVSDDSSV